MPSQPSGPLRKGDVAAFVPGGVVSSRPVRVLVTGGHGFVGSHLVERLLAGGVEVRCLSRRREVPERLRGLALEVVAGDLETGVGLRAALVGVEEVWHLGALTRSRTRREMLAVNTAGTLRLAREALDLGLSGRFVFCSSLAAVGPATGPHALTEEAPLQPVTTYGLSKRRAEEGLALLGSKLPWVIVRPPAVYGPRDRDQLDLFRFAKAGVVPLPPRGKMAVIHVDDLARLLLALVPGGEDVSHELFEPDDGHVGGWSHKSFARAIGWAVGKRITPLPLPAFALRAAARGDRLLRRAAAKLTEDRVGYMCHPDWTVRDELRPPVARWLPEIGTRDGLKATAKWYREAGWL